MGKLNIELNGMWGVNSVFLWKNYFLSHFMFSSHVMLIPTFLREKKCMGACQIFFWKTIFSHFMFSSRFMLFLFRGGGGVSFWTSLREILGDRVALLTSWQTFWRHDVFLAPPAERQRSFSNTDLSVVRLSVRLSVRPSVCPSVCPSRLRGGGVYLRNASVTFLLFWHGASLGWHKSHIER